MAAWAATDSHRRATTFFGKYLAAKYPESFDSNVPDALVYSGNVKLTDAVNGSPLNAGKLVLSPTRTYAPIIKAILNKYSSRDIHGMVHCSGGAQTKILHFIENGHIIKDNMFAVPPLFKLIQEQSKNRLEGNVPGFQLRPSHGIVRAANNSQRHHRNFAVLRRCPRKS